MKFEYELFNSVPDLLMVASNSFSLGMRQISTMFLYGEYVVFYSPTLSGENDESVWLISMAKGKLPIGLIEFDPETKEIVKILKPVNPEKSHFLVVEPKESTILEKAIANYEKSH